MQLPPNQPNPYHPVNPLAQPPPKRPRRRRLWLILGIIVGSLLLCFIFAGIMGTLTNAQLPQTTQATSTPTQVPTTAPTSTPTKPPTAVPTRSPLDGTVIGGTQNAFTTKYGQPSQDIGGLFFYQNLQVSVTSDNHVDNMLVGVPKNQQWSMTTGQAQCQTFFPSDAITVKNFATADVDQQNDGVAYIYVSHALSQVFPSSRFTDQQHHQLTPGTFSVAYGYLFDQSKNVYNSTQFLQCEINLGIPDTIKAFTSQAKPTPTSAPSHTGVNGNPWGYDFSSGKLIYNPPSNFCDYFACISNFWNGSGFVNECNDGSYSKSGGIRGDCSYHGGEARPLYSH